MLIKYALIGVIACATGISGCKRESSAPLNSVDTESVDSISTSNKSVIVDDRELDNEEGGKVMRFVADAIKKMRNGDVDEALLAIQTAVTLDEENFDARWHIVVMLQRRGLQRLRDGHEAEGYQDLMELETHLLWLEHHTDRLDDSQKETLAIANYNAACAFSKADKPKKAIAFLTTALSLGFDDLEKVNSDKDLDPLRALEDFNALIDKLKDSDSDSDNPESNDSTPESQPSSSS